MVEVTPVDPTVTYGSIVTLNCSYDVINNTANLTIEWTTTASNMDLSSVSMAGDTSSMLTLSNVDLSHSGNYTCDVVNDDTNTTEGTDSIVLTVNRKLINVFYTTYMYMYTPFNNILISLQSSLIFPFLSL